MNVFRNLKSEPKLIGGLLTVTFIVVVVAFIVWQNSGIAPALTSVPRQASVVELRNDVSAREAASAEWLEASIGQEILVGGGVKTGEEARARVDISDGTILRLGSSTEFTLVALSPEPTNATTKWSLVAGKVWLFVSEALGSGSFEIETPLGVATVRGSYLGLQYAPATGQIVATCLEGVCRLTGSTGTFTNLTTGQQSEIAGAGQSPSPGHPMDVDRLAEWAREYPEAGNIVTTITPAPLPTLTPAPPTPTATPIEASMWCDLWVNLDGPAGGLASRNPSFGFEAQVQGGNAIQVVAESPSGEIFTLPPFSDIPYGREQRFGTHGMIPGLPQVGRTYMCTALDTAGTPIPGAVAFDAYVGGNEPDPPTNVRAEVVEAGILVAWKPSPVIPGSFDPSGSPPIGYYVIFLFREGGEFLYGWNGGISLPEASHLIPLHRHDFGPDDAGLSLEELDDGIYFVHAYARSVAPEGTDGRKDECWAEDSAQSIRVVIEGGQVRVEAP